MANTYSECKQGIEGGNVLFAGLCKWCTRKLALIAIAIAASGVVWIIAEEISIQLYINAPCEHTVPCDTVVGRSQVPSGALLIIAAAIIFVAESVIWPSKTTAPSSVN